MKSARNFGRRERSNAPSSPPPFGSTIRLSTSPPWAKTTRSPARSGKALQRPPDQDLRGRVRLRLLAQGRDDDLSLGPGEPQGDERLGGLDFRLGGCRDTLLGGNGGQLERHFLEPVRKLQRDPLRQFLPDAVDSREGRRVSPRACGENSGNPHPRQDRYGGLRTDPAHADDREKDLPLRLGGKTEELGPPLANLEESVKEARLSIRGKIGPRDGGDVHAEPHSRALHHDEILPPARKAAPQMVDHCGSSYHFFPYRGARPISSLLPGASPSSSGAIGLLLLPGSCSVPENR